MTDLKEVKGIIDKVSGWVQGQGPKQEKRGKAWSSITGLVIGAIALFTVAYISWRAHRQGKKLAKLQHERDVAEQRKITNEVSARVMKNAARAATLRKQAEESKAKIEELDKEIAEIEARRTRNKNEIDAVKNWDDVARLRAGGGS